MGRLLALIIPVLAVMISGSMAWADTPTSGLADAQVKQLLILMDQDRNGKISRKEFMDFMGAEFDRLDVDKNGELDMKELKGLRVTPTKHPGGSGSR